MIQEALLAYFHLIAIGMMIVFIAAQAALCRPALLNADGIHMLAKLEMIVAVAAVLVWTTGLTRVFLGLKGTVWYAGNPLLHWKVGLFLLSFAMSIKPTLMFKSWRKELLRFGTLPNAGDIATARRFTMAQAFLLPLIPLFAVFLARGFGGH